MGFLNKLLERMNLSSPRCGYCRKRITPGDYFSEKTKEEFAFLDHYNAEFNEELGRKLFKK